MKTMRASFALFLLFLLVQNILCFDEGGVSVEHQWSDGLIGKFSITPGSALSKGWNMIVTFSKPIKLLEVWQANLQMKNKENTVFVLKNQSWNKQVAQGQKLEFNFKATKKGRGNLQIAEVAVGRQEHLDGLSC